VKDLTVSSQRKWALLFAWALYLQVSE